MTRNTLRQPQQLQPQFRPLLRPEQVPSQALVPHLQMWQVRTKDLHFSAVHYSCTVISTCANLSKNNKFNSSVFRSGIYNDLLSICGTSWFYYCIPNSLWEYYYCRVECVISRHHQHNSRQHQGCNYSILYRVQFRCRYLSCQDVNNKCQ